MGQKKFLWKCENRNFTSSINKIEVIDGRIFVSDWADSIHVMNYKPEEGIIYEFADDPIPRYIT